MKFLKIADVIDKTTLGKSTIYRLLKEGTFPAPHHIGGGRSIIWLEEEIEEWMVNSVRKDKP